jgi:hypothetical protein
MADDEDGAITDRTTITIGLSRCLRPEYHQLMLPRISELSGVASRFRRYLSQVINLYLLNQNNPLPPVAELELFLYHGQKLFCQVTDFQNGMLNVLVLMDDAETLELRQLEHVFQTQYRPLMIKEDGTVRII